MKNGGREKDNKVHDYFICFIFFVFCVCDSAQQMSL